MSHPIVRPVASKYRPVPNRRSGTYADRPDQRGARCYVGGILGHVRCASAEEGHLISVAGQVIIVSVGGIAQRLGGGGVRDAPNAGSVDGLSRFAKGPPEDLAEPRHDRWWGHLSLLSERPKF